MPMVKTTGEFRLKYSQQAHPGFLSESCEDLRGQVRRNQRLPRDRVRCLSGSRLKLYR